MMTTLGKELRKTRIDRDMRQGVLAREAKISQKYLSQIEHDIAVPTFTIMRRLAHVLSMSLDHLCVRLDDTCTEDEV